MLYNFLQRMLFKAQIMDYQEGFHLIIIVNLSSRYLSTYFYYVFFSSFNLSFPSPWRQRASARVIQFH